MSISFEVSELDMNLDTLNESGKYLTVIFMASTAITSVVMFLVAVCSPRCHQQMPKDSSMSQTGVRCAIRISLSLTGLVLASFSLLVLALRVFRQQDHGLNCLTINLSVIYINEVLPLLYACALVVMTIDVICRSKIASVSDWIKLAWKSFYSSIICTVLPWIISLVIVCPLALTGVDWSDNCRTEQDKQQAEVRMIVCGLVPALVVFISGICALTWQTSSSDQTSDNTFDFPMYQGQGCVDNQSSATDHPLPTKGVTQANHPYVVGMENALDTGYSNKYIGHSSQITDASTRFESGHSSAESRSTQQRSQEKAKLKGRHERLIAFVLCVVFVITVVPYNAVRLYVMEAYTPLDDALDNGQGFVYKVDPSLFIAVYVFAWLNVLYPVAIPILWVVLSF